MVQIGDLSLNLDLSSPIATRLRIRLKVSKLPSAERFASTVEAGSLIQ